MSLTLAMLLQQELEGISEELRIPGQKALGPIQGVRSCFIPAKLAAAMCSKSWHVFVNGAVHLWNTSCTVQAVKRAHNILNQDKQKIAKDFAPDKKARPLTALSCPASWHRLQQVRRA